MIDRIRALAAGLAIAAVLAGTAVQAQSTLSQDDAKAIAANAYLYFYPLVTMDVTRKQLANLSAEESAYGGPANWFTNVRAYPAADARTVVRPNFDTLYSSAWLDLTEPMVVSVPDTGGRYYLLPMLDMWTNVFASPGWRTTGTGAAHYLLTPPDWNAAGTTIPEGLLHIEAPTPHVWIIGRTKTDGPADYDAVHKIQDGYIVTPLSRWGQTPEEPAQEIDRSVDVKTPPKTQVDTMAAADYFAYAAELLKENPPQPTDQPILAQLQRLGFERGKSFTLANAEPIARAAFEAAPAAAQAMMAYQTPRLARVVDGWVMNTDTMGVYGTYYLKRAIVTQVGLGANLVEDAIYPLNVGDSEGRPLDGASDYVLHFEAAELPPANAFWSVTLYDNDGFQVANQLDRFALSSWMPFAINADGSLDLYIQYESPGGAKEANWLPAPAGPFNLTMRLYAPKAAALTGRWTPPAVSKVSKLPHLSAQ